MHITFFIFSLSAGGAERFTANMANHWVQIGHKVSVVSFAGLENDTYDLDPGVQRKSLNLDTPSRSIWSAISGNMARVRALNSYLRTERPDVAIGIMSTASILLAFTPRRLCPVRIGTERSYPPSMPLGRIWETLRARFYRRLDTVVGQTNETVAWLEANTNARQVTALPNPINYPLARQEPVLPPDRWLGAGRKTVLAVGRLGPEKGYDRLIAAFAGLASTCPDWDLVIIGEGSERAALESQRDELGLTARVHLPGRAGNVADWYEAANLFALTSHFEGFPNVLIEAMAHGLPAVSVDCNTGPRDVIDPGTDGLLVPQDDHNALRQALEVLMTDGDRRIAMAKRATDVRQKFSIVDIAARWEALIESCAARPGK